MIPVMLFILYLVVHCFAVSYGRRMGKIPVHTRSVYTGRWTIMVYIVFTVTILYQVKFGPLAASWWTLSFALLPIGSFFGTIAIERINPVKPSAGAL
jgi:hypothetical protein